MANVPEIPASSIEASERTSWRWRLRGHKDRNVKQGASARLLFDDHSLEVMLDAMRNAKEQIVFECYMIMSDEMGGRLIDVLCEKAKAGIGVWLVFDAVGSRLLKSEDRKRLREAGAYLRIFHRLRLWRFDLFLRTHRRILVIDDNVGYIGGYGFSDDWTDRSKIGKYHELVWELRGSVVADLLRSFRWGCGRRFKKLPTMYKIDPAPENLPYRIYNLSRYRREGAMRQIAGGLSNTAQSRLWIAMGYFVPTLLLRNALVRAARRGVDVRLYLTGPKTDHPFVRHAARRRYRRLLKAGVRIFETIERPMHAKCLIMDESYANLGSANMDRWSILFNRELNVEIHDGQVTRELGAALLSIEQASKEIMLHDWDRRPFSDKVVEFFAGFVESVL